VAFLDFLATILKKTPCNQWMGQMSKPRGDGQFTGASLSKGPRAGREADPLQFVKQIGIGWGDSEVRLDELCLI